ncbi:MAG: ribose 5-phosphate isomerase B [Bernardetiaceae bacterium]|nr:ribose 5-phosphate isomerase B [Bernardetiaceae bacterium]
MQIAIGGDHAGYTYKKALIQMLETQGHKVKDFGPHSEESVDYPDFVHPLAQAISNHTYDLGILICGSGNGVAMTANKYAQVRAALCWTEELSLLARSHNNANILCLPARFIPLEKAQAISSIFIASEFEGGRHQRRVEKIAPKQK